MANQRNDRKLVEFREKVDKHLEGMPCLFVFDDVWYRRAWDRTDSPST